MAIALRVAVGAAAAFLLAGSAAAQCSVTNPNTNKIMDFTSVKSSTYYILQSQYPTFRFLFNVCGSISYAGTSEVCPQGSTCMCEVSEDNGAFEPSETYAETSTGAMVWKATNLPQGVSPGPAYTASHSAQCARGGGAYKMEIYFICDENAATPYAEMIEDDYWECSVTAKLFTDKACASGGAPPAGQNGFTEEDETDVGMILCVLFFVFGAIYVGGGMAYNIKVKGKDKYDAVPNKEFWMSLPGLVKAGFEFTKVKCQELYEKYKTRQSYQQL